MSARGVLRIVESANLGFWCPGCKGAHYVNGGWTFNGDYDRPTFTPSVLVTGGHYTPRFKPGDSCWCTFKVEHPDLASFDCTRCHSFVTNGQIQFLDDCTHELAGKTVALEPFP